MKAELNFDTSNSKYFSYIPYLTIFLAQLIVGKVTDTLLEKKLVRKIVLRKVCETVGLGIPGICLGLLCLKLPIYGYLILMVFLLPC